MNRVIFLCIAMFLSGCSTVVPNHSEHTIDLTQLARIGTINKETEDTSNAVTRSAAGTETAARGSAIGGSMSAASGAGVVGIATLAALAPPTLLISVPVSLAIMNSNESNSLENQHHVYYSYVVTGKSLKGSNSRTLYDLLVTEIKNRYPDLSQNSEYPISTDNDLNLYIIPVKSNDANKTDYELSSYIVNTLADMHPETFSSSGPFIVTISQPLLFCTQKNVDMYFYDLTNISPETIPEFIKDYRQVNFNNVIKGFKKHKSNKIEIHNLIFKANNYLESGINQFNKLVLSFSGESVVF